MHIEVRDAWLSFSTASGDPLPVLQAISLEASAGDILTIVGPSGCGKTSLLKLCAGLLEPTAGQILVDGEAPAPAAHRLRIAYVPQRPTLLPWRTVLENVTLPLELAYLEETGGGAQILAAVGLAEFSSAFPHQLSGGMQARVALARALLPKPRLLIMDEPFSSLDEVTREQMGRLLLSFCADLRPTVLFVTHNVAEAVTLGNSVLVLSRRPARLFRRFDISTLGANAGQALWQTVGEVHDALLSAASE